MSIAGKVTESLRQDGLVQLSRKTTLYLLRRVSWRTDAWSKRLDRSIARKSLLKEYGPLLERNEFFRDRHKGQRCFVIGNGPSLNKQDLSPLAQEITFVTNSFHLHPIVGDAWQPSYYLLTDPEYFTGDFDPSFFQELTERIKSAPFIVPHFAREFLEKTGALPPERTYFIAITEAEEDYAEKPDLTGVVPGMQTVVQLAMLAAMYMGCSHIYLLGMDHDWLSHGGEHVNFYSEEEAESQPDGNIRGWDYRSMMEAVLNMWRIYGMLRRIAQAQDVRIINVTHGGFLDVFERGSYEQLFQESPAAGPVAD